MISIGRLARQFGLSRSTLLYYDRIGVLSPPGRTETGYRSYSRTDQLRLKRICTYREAGLSLRVIRQVLDGPQSELGAALERRLDELTDEMNTLKNRQGLICSLLQRALPESREGLTREVWSELLTASGYTDDDMHAWHQAFERNAPEKHQTFLEFLNIPALEIEDIRTRSRCTAADSRTR